MCPPWALGPVKSKQKVAVLTTETAVSIWAAKVTGTLGGKFLEREVRTAQIREQTIFQLLIDS